VIAIGVNVTSFTTTASQAISAGRNYVFRVRARNVIGFSLDSSDIIILAATRPIKLAAPILTPTLVDTSVVVDWVA